MSNSAFFELIDRETNLKNSQPNNRAFRSSNISKKKSKPPIEKDICNTINTTKNNTLRYPSEFPKLTKDKGATATDATSILDTSNKIQLKKLKQREDAANAADARQKKGGKKTKRRKTKRRKYKRTKKRY